MAALPDGAKARLGVQGAARVEGEHALGEAHTCRCPPPEAVPVDGLALGDARVVHEHEPDPEGILRQRRRHVLTCLALRLHLTPKDLSNAPPSAASNISRRAPEFYLYNISARRQASVRGPGDGARPSSAISLSPARRVAAYRTNVRRTPAMTQTAAMIGYHFAASVG